VSQVLREPVAVEGERLNAYWCDDCRHYIVTRDVHKGVTPMFLACRFLGDPRDPANTCKGTMRSMMYPPLESWPEHPDLGGPSWEWFKPTVRQVRRMRRRGDLAGVEHVEKGGLLLRPVGGEGMAPRGTR
jgi:hypothetical protein